MVVNAHEPDTQAFADLWREFYNSTNHVAADMSDQDLTKAALAFESYTTTNCEWTHYGAKPFALDAIHSEQRRRRDTIRWIQIGEKQDEIEKLKSELECR